MGFTVIMLCSTTFLPTIIDFLQRLKHRCYFVFKFIYSHAWPLVKDLERLPGLYARVNVCPLGSGALAGNPFHVDRENLARDLGFQSVTKNSLNAVGDRDFVGMYVCLYFI